MLRLMRDASFSVIHLASALGGRAFAKKKSNAMALSSDVRVFKGINATRPSVAHSYS